MFKKETENKKKNKKREKEKKRNHKVSRGRKSHACIARKCDTAFYILCLVILQKAVLDFGRTS